ncbi:MAG: hypothetical protein IJY54_06320, partial [Paludibacteraceae bacterium]|nr:hypothetical protein [Paludibacteraceae bacterium]
MIYSFRKKLVIIAILTFTVASFYAKAAVPVHINSGNPAFPFPQFLDYGPDRKSLASHNAPGVTHAEMEQRMRDAWKHICNNCKFHGYEVDGVEYIIPDKNEAEDHCSCAEGDGYYLLPAAIMGDKTFFDGYYMSMHDRMFIGVDRYVDGGTNLYDNYSKNLNGSGSLGMGAAMTIGNYSEGGSATDGDVDIALALLIAYKQWGESSGITTRYGELNYKEEALKYIRAMVDTVLYPLSGTTYVSGVVGFDGYLKGGSHQTNLTDWASNGGGRLYKGMKNEHGGKQMLYFDYLAPAYFRQYRKFLEEDKNSTEWQINQCLRCEASSDWLMGQLYQSSNTAIPVCGSVTSISDTEFTFGNEMFAEDMRAGWRTILNYVWHGDPEYSWDPITHEVIPGTNSYQKDMALRYAKFLANPQSAPWNNDCNAIGDMGLKFWGPYTLRNVMDLEGNIGAGFPLNWIHGSGSPAAIVSQDFELMGQMFRHCVMTWDDENFKSYEESSPHYFHEWFKLLGMLVLSGNFHAPENMVAKPNLKVYHKVDKTYAFAGDEVEFVVSVRNYGSVDADGTVVKFGVPEGFSLVSTTKGSLVGDSIVWEKGVVPGFQTATGIKPTVDSMVIKLRLNDDIKQGRYCTSASVKCDNGFGWVSDEYPNNVTSVMERNCVDVVARALKVKKTVDRKEINPNNIAQFKIDFENSAEAGWINGGRQGVRLSYGHKPVANPSSTDQIVSFYRLFHDADEAYIDYGNYRVSYYMYDPALQCMSTGGNDPDCNVGWYIDRDYYQGGEKESLIISHETTVPGTDPVTGKKWNQRIIVQFADQLAAPTQHLQQYASEGVADGIHVHEGGGSTLLLNMRMSCSKGGKMFDLTDDWSYSEDWTSAEQNDLHYPIVNDHTDPNNLDQEITSWDRHSCGTPTKFVDKILVEEWDGYTWRRVLGNGPKPGRDVYNVVIRDTLPKGMEFVEFVNECPLEEFGGSWTTEKTADGLDVIVWTIDRLMIEQKGSIIYKANITFPSGNTCETADEEIINKAWIWGDKESAINDTASITVTCAKVPKPIIPTTLKKTADKESYEVGEEINYAIEYEQTHGAIFDDAAANTSDWNLSGWSVSGGTLTSVSNQTGTSRYNYSKAKNYFVKMDVNPQTYSTFQIIFREGSSSPLTIQIKPDLGQNILFITTFEGGKVVQAEKELIFKGGVPMSLSIDVQKDLMRMWINSDTVADKVIYTVEGLTEAEGYLAFKNGNTTGGDSYGTHKFSNIHVHTDYAYNLSIIDRKPEEISFISADEGGILEGDSIVWKFEQGINNPIPFGTKYKVSWKGTVDECNEKIINVAYAKLLGHADDEIMAQAVSECGSSCPIEKVTLTAAASEICEGDSVLLTAAAEPAGNYEYEFFLDKVSLGAPSASDELYVKKKGAYTVKVYDAADNSCSKESSKVEVTVDSIPPFSLGNDISLCSGGTAWIKTGLPTGYTYEWSNGAAEDSIEVNAAGEYSVKVSSSICEAFDTIQVTVADELIVDLGPDTTVCATSLPHILDATAIYDTYEWSDASTASTLEVMQSGEYTVKVTQGSCSGEGKVTVTVSEVEKLKGTFEVTYLVSDTTANGVFANNLTTQDADVLEKVSGIQYTWMKADGTPLLEEPTPDVPAAGSSATETYKVYGVNADGCPTDTATINVTISGAPVPVVSDTSYCEGETSQALTATPSPSSDGATWTLQWYDANKSPLTAAPTPSTAASGETTYYVSQKSGNNESGLVPVTVKVYGAATPDVSQNQLAYCLGDTYNNPTATVTANATTLQMQGTLEWKVGATAWDGVSPVDYASGGTKVSVVNKYEISASHVCVSDTASFTVSVTELAKPTGDLSVNYVKTEGASGTFPSLTDKNANVAVPSTGNQLVWYDAAGTKQTDTPTPQYDNNWAAGKDSELTYFVSQTDGTCESDTVTVKVTISDSPMPTAAPVSYCQNAQARALTASINTTVDGAEKYVLLWYTTATGGTAQDSIVPTTDLVGSTTYYVSQKHKYTNAESSRTSVVVTVHALPDLGATTPDAQCGGSVDLSTLFSEKNNLSVKYDFYEDATTATALSSSAVTVGKTYYAEGYYEINATATTTAVCRSVARTPVTVTIDDLSGLAIAGDATVCPNGTVELTARATSTSPGTITYSWEGGAASTTSIYTTPVITG